MHGHRASSQYRSSDSSTSFLTVLQNNIYSAYGGKFYYPAAASGSPGVYLNYYPFYAQHGQNSPSYYPRVIQNSQQYNAFGTLSNPTSASSLPNTSLVSWAILFVLMFHEYDTNIWQHAMYAEAAEARPAAIAEQQQWEYQ
jgi:hypothetical protein